MALIGKVTSVVMNMNGSRVIHSLSTYNICKDYKNMKIFVTLFGNKLTITAATAKVSLLPIVTIKGTAKF